MSDGVGSTATAVSDTAQPAAAAEAISPNASLFASYREFQAREAARQAMLAGIDAPAAAAASPSPAANAAEAEAPAPPRRSLDPVPNAADQPNAVLLEPIQPYYSSAASPPPSTPPQPTSARKPAASRIAMPSVVESPAKKAAASKPPSVVSSAQKFSDLSRGTSSSELRRQSISDRRASLAATRERPLEQHAEAFATTPRRGVLKSTQPIASTPSSAATTPRPRSASVSSATPQRPRSAATTGGSASVKAKPKAASTPVAVAPPTPATVKRMVRKSLTPAFASAEKKAAPVSTEKPTSKFSQIKSAGRAKGSFATNFEVLEPKAGSPHKAASASEDATTPRRKSILDEPLEPAEEEEEDAEEEETALVASASPSAVATLAPRPSQIIATLSSPPRHGGSLVAPSLHLANLPHSASRKVPLSLMARGGDATDCASCHELHMRSNKLSLDLARALASLQDAHAAKLHSDAATKASLRLTAENEALSQKLAKSEARGATMSNQLTTLRLDADRHLRSELQAQAEAHAASVALDAGKNSSQLGHELEITRTKLDSVTLEKKGLITRLATASTAKRALEKTLSSLEQSYKVLQEAHEVALVQAQRARYDSQTSEAFITAQRDDTLQRDLELTRMEMSQQALKHEKADLENELAQVQHELEHMRASTQGSANYVGMYSRAKASLEAADARVQDLEDQLRDERELVRQAREQNEQAQAEAEEASIAAEADLEAMAASSRSVAQAVALGNSYKLEVEAVRAELLQLQREKAETIEDNLLLRRQVQVLKRTTGQQDDWTEPPQRRSQTQRPAPLATSPPPPQQQEEDEYSSQQPPAPVQQQPTPRGSRPTSRLSSPRASPRPRHETPSPRPRQGSPSPHPSSSPRPTSSPSHPGVGVPGAKGGAGGARGLYGRAATLAKSASASSTAMRASSLSPVRRGGFGAAGSPRGNAVVESPSPSASAPSPLPTPLSPLSPFRYSLETTEAERSVGSAFAASLVSSSMGDPVDAKERTKMLASMQFFKTHYSSDDATQQALLVLEGLMQQASILQGKMDDKASRAREAEGREAEERLTKELRIITSTLSLTKDNIRAHWQALLATLAQQPGAPPSSSTSQPQHTSSVLSSPRLSSPIGHLTRPLFTAPAFASSLSGGGGAGSVSSTSSLSDVLGSNNSNTTAFSTATLAAPAANRFATWSASYAPTGTLASPVRSSFTVPQSLALFSPPSSSSQPQLNSAALRYNSLASPVSTSSSIASIAPAGSFFSHAGSTTSQIHRTLASPYGQAASSGGQSFGGPTQSFGQSSPFGQHHQQQQAGGSTFNLQVSRDAKNIYISHQASPAPTAAPASSPSSAFQRLALAPPTPTPMQSSFASSASQFMPPPSVFASSPSQHYSHGHHTSFASTPGGGLAPTSSFLSPAAAGHSQAATPFSATRTYQPAF